jgi:hypothetical protein
LNSSSLGVMKMILTSHRKNFHAINNNNISVDVFLNVIVLLLVQLQREFIFRKKIQPLFLHHHINILVHHSNEIIPKDYILSILIIKNLVIDFQLKNMNNRLLHVDMGVSISHWQVPMRLIFLHIVCKQQWVRN